MTTKLTKEEAYAQLWEQSIVSDWLLDPAQKELLHLYKTTKNRKIVGLFARQTGKSFACLTIAVEECLRNPNFIVTFVSEAQTQARKIAKTTMREILDTCPPHLQPEYKTQENLFRFSNGSYIELIGNNAGHIEKARGPKANLVICDEVGFWDDMKYSINSVLFPKLNTTKGKILIITTPPPSNGHPVSEFISEARAKKSLITKTIFDCERYTKEDIEAFASELGGMESIDFRREYLCEMLVNKDKAVIPEATDELMSEVVLEWKRPPFYDTYVAMDFGLKDLTAIIFAYYDFRIAKVIIEDEIVIKDPSFLRTDYIADCIRDKELDLWASLQDEEFAPTLRIADANPMLLNDLYLQHGLIVQQTSRDDLNGAINNARLMLSSGRVIIHPRCKNLIFHLQNATWKNEKKNDFARSPDTGHYDFVAAFIYLLRNIYYGKNPYPPYYDMNITGDSFISPGYKHPSTSTFKESINDIFSLKSTYRKRK